MEWHVPSDQHSQPWPSQSAGANLFTESESKQTKKVLKFVDYYVIGYGIESVMLYKMSENVACSRLLFGPRSNGKHNKFGYS